LWHGKSFMKLRHSETQQSRNKYIEILKNGDVLKWICVEVLFSG